MTEDGDEVPKEIHKLIYKNYFRLMDECDACFELGLPEGATEKMSVGQHLRTLMEPVFAELKGREEALARMVFESLLLQENGVSGTRVLFTMYKMINK